jgi:death on curing protein
VSRDYLTVSEVLGMHIALISRYGGAPGVRDPGWLEAARFRPQTGYCGDVVAEAAAMMESLAINHPFVDGNNRIAFAAADVRLRSRLAEPSRLSAQADTISLIRVCGTAIS